MKIKLPDIDLKFKDLVVGELVVLKPEIDDKNCKRIYNILSREENKLSVEIISENVINNNKYQQASRPSQVGKIFENVDAIYFQSYL